jgi:mono/diheme cytochrome c family protein
VKRVAVGIAGASAALVTATAVAIWQPWVQRSPADPDNGSLVAEGAAVYAERCASCHGAKLEGQPDWRKRLPSGRLPAPPHEATGHTWHHPDDVLFGMTKHGVGPYAPTGYQSDMPAFDQILSDHQIWAVLAFIKSSWPEHIREIQQSAKPMP